MALDVDRLLALEVKRVKGLLACEAFKSTAALPNFSKLTPEELVRRCYDMHEDLVQRWGGWACHGEIGEIEESDETRFERTTLIWQRWHQLFYRAQRDESDGLSTNDEFSMHITVSNWGRLQSAEGLLARKTVELVESWRGKNVKLFLGYWSKTLTEEARVARAKEVFGAETYERDPKLYLSEISPFAHIEISTLVRHGERLTAAAFRALEQTAAPPVWREKLEKLFQELGEKVWNAGKLKVAVSVTCAPSAFLRLGHYGEKSCYKNGGAHQAAKWWLATDQPGSFVALAYQPKTKDGKLAVSTRTGARVGKVVGRGWGIGMPGGDGVFITNFYLLGFDQLMPQVRPLLTRAFELGDKIELLQHAKLSAVKNTLWHRMAGPLSKAVFLNKDSALLLRKDLAEVMRDAHAVLEYTTMFGLHTNQGSGPDKRILYYAGAGNLPARWLPKTDLIAEARKWAEKMGWKIFERSNGMLAEVLP